MPRFEWDIRIGAALLFPLLFYFDNSGVFAAALPAIFFHELGHCVAVRLCGGRIVSLQLDTAGLILTASPLSPTESLIASLSGPCLGFLWAAAAGRLRGAYWQQSAQIAWWLNLINVLPALPLDGGQILYELRVGNDLLRITTLITAALFVGVAAFCRSPLPLLPVPAMVHALIRLEERL